MPPRLSVVIVTRNRRDVLQRCLQKYATQTLREIEFIVMDNGSTDGTDVMVRDQYPHIVYRNLGENAGPIAFNRGAELALAPLLFRTDDDAYPEQPTTLERGVTFLEQHPSIAVLAGDVIDERSGALYNWHPHAERYETIPENGLDVGFFYGACAILRKEPFFEAGGFWDRFYIEEADLSARLIALGQDVRYVPWMRTIHVGAFDKRDKSQRWLLMSEQIVRYQFRYFPFWRALYRSAVVGISQLALAVYHRISLGKIAAGLRSMYEAGFKAHRSERVLLTSEQIQKATLGESIVANTLRYYKTARTLKRNMKKTKTDD